jgi:oligosaccharide repeat unit polymerase
LRNVKLNYTLQYLSILIYAIILIHTFFCSRSIIAPINIFIILIGFFFSSIFFNNHSVLVYIIYFSILFLVLFHNLITFDWVQSKKIYIIQSHSYCYPHTRFLLCLIAILFSLFLFINKFGGLASFIIASKRGTEEFYGLGHYKTIVNMIYPLGLVSYIMHNFNKNKKILDSIVNIIIQLFVIFIALLSLSRGTIINYFVSIIIIRHILGIRVSKLSYFLFPILAITFASFFGVVRETLNFNDDNFSLGLEKNDEKFKTEWMEFGTFPIEQINLYHSKNNPSLGLTYLTAFTNLIPRNIWSGKPDPGGVVFTRDYTNGLYDEFNQYSTGIFPEAMINFGIIGGYFFGLFFFTILLIFSTFLYYKYYLNGFRFNKEKDIIILVFYAYIFMSLPILTTAEFTNVITSLILKFITLFIIYKILFIKFNYETKIKLHLF